MCAQLQVHLFENSLYLSFTARYLNTKDVVVCQGANHKLKDHPTNVLYHRRYEKVNQSEDLSPCRNSVSRN